MEWWWLCICFKCFSNQEHVLLYPLVAGKELSFLQIALRLETRLSKKTIQAISEVEFYSTTKRGRGELRTMGRSYHGNCSKSFNSKRSGKSVTGVGSLALCNGLPWHESRHDVDRKSPSTVHDADHWLNAYMYQLSHQVFDKCRRQVPMMAVDRQSQGLGCTSVGKVN